MAQKLFVQAWQLVEFGSNPDAKEPFLKPSPSSKRRWRVTHDFCEPMGLVTSHIDLYWQGFDHTPARLRLGPRRDRRLRR